MAKIFMPEVDPKNRLRLLQDNCDSHEQTTYLKDLTQEELDAKRETICNNAIAVSGLDEDLKAAKDNYKAKSAPLKEESKILLSEVRTRRTKVNGTLYNIADHESNMMEQYDENGELVATRRLKAEEKQGRLKVVPAPAKAVNE